MLMILMVCPMYDSSVAGLNYIIPPGNNNCGAGTYTRAQVAALDEATAEGGSGVKVGDPQSVTGPIATDVGYGLLGRR